ncbi:MAG TPA: hypothetical protein VFC78_12295, partial [Tepidisphaeraceae bacterium]|nr:hypothetical protein [Tepidisphaeraceae bacterium]
LPPPTYDGLTIPVAHARLWWTPARLQQAKVWYAANPFTPRANDPMNNALAYVLTGNTAYAQNAINSLMNFTIRQSELDSAAASNDYRWNDWVPVVFDWCHDQMTAAQQSTFIARYNGYVYTIMRKSWGGPTMPSNNYFWGYLRNELNWGIATYYEDTVDAQAFINDALVTRYENSFVPWAASTGRGGVAVEGSEYGRYLLEYSTVPFATAALLGQDLYSKTNFYKEAVYNLIYGTTPGPSTDIAGDPPAYQLMPSGDDEFGTGYPPAADEYYGFFMTQMAQEYAGTPTAEYARQWLNVTGAGAAVQTDSLGQGLYVAATDPGGPAQSFSALPLDYYAPGPGYLYAKSGWDPSAMETYFQLGSRTADHEHLDAGSFQIWAGGSWVTKESTGYSTPIANYGGNGTIDASATVAHNAVLIGGIGQANAYVDGPARVTRVESNPLYSFSSVDLSQAYRASKSPYPSRDDNPYAGNVVRDFLYIRPLNALISLDRLESNTVGTTDASQVEKAFLLHFPNNPTITGNSAVGIAGSEQLTLTALTPQGQSAPTMRVVNETQGLSSLNAGTDYQYRLEEATSGSPQSYLVNVMQATAAGAQGLTATMAEDASSFTITLRDPTRGTAVVVLQKGMQSAGGAVGFSPDPNATPTPTEALGAGVENITVTSQGPVWGG